MTRAVAVRLTRRMRLIPSDSRMWAVPTKGNEVRMVLIGGKKMGRKNWER